MIREEFRERGEGDDYAAGPAREASGQLAQGQDFQLCDCAGGSAAYDRGSNRRSVKAEKSETVKSKPVPTAAGRRMIVLIYAGVFAVVGLLSAVFFFRTYEEYAQLRRVEAETRQRIARAEQRLKDQERVLDRLRNDPAFVEKIIRLQLRYAKPTELIFRFEE
jgi:cell division protein FtsB